MSRICLVLLGIAIAWVISLRVFAAGPSMSQDTNLTSPTEWLSHQCFERLGDPSADPKLNVVFAPKEVIASAQLVLASSPSTWLVQHKFDWQIKYSARNFQNSAEVVALIGSTARLVFAVQPDRWIRLNDPRNLDALNKILLGNFHSPYSQWTNRSTSDEKSFLAPTDMKPGDWDAYAEGISDLYSFSFDRLVLSDEFLRDYKDHLNYVLLGKEKDPDVLTSLCKAPLITHSAGQSIVNFNLMTSLGGVQHWKIFLKSPNSLAIQKIDIEPVLPDGTFLFPNIN